jgi:hypothetical protein
MRGALTDNEALERAEKVLADINRLATPAYPVADPLDMTFLLLEIENLSRTALTYPSSLED